MAKKKVRKPTKKAPALAPEMITEMQDPAPAPEVSMTEVKEEKTEEKPTVTEAATTPSKGLTFVGVWAYIVGIAVALLGAIFVWNGIDYISYTALAILGIIVGLLNITDDEVQLFLIASVAFLVSATGVRMVLNDITFLATFMNGIIIFTAASAFIVSFKAIFRVAKTR